MDIEQPNTENEHRAQVQDLVVQHGLRGAARLIGVHSQTVLSLIAGVRVQSGTWALVRERLHALSKRGTP